MKNIIKDTVHEDQLNAILGNFCFEMSRFIYDFQDSDVKDFYKVKMSKEVLWQIRYFKTSIMECFDYDEKEYVNKKELYKDDSE